MAGSSTDAKPALRILYIASEADPLVKVGGLGDVAGSLPRMLRAIPASELGGRRLDVRLAIPFHSAIDTGRLALHPVASFPIHHAAGPVTARVFLSDVAGLPVYLIAGAPIPAGGPVYSLVTGEDGRKFAFFSQAALELALRLDGTPVDVLHANDWHTAAALYALQLRRAQDPAAYPRLRTVLSIHNLPFMGIGSEPALLEYGLPPTRDERLPDWARGAPLPLGLLASDRIAPVSPGYAQEILTPEFGCGLEGFLRGRADAITGILNGIDTAAWDPAADANLAARYDVTRLALRDGNKAALQAELGLDEDPRVPLLVAISRMDRQKGIDIALDGLRLVADVPWQAVILGSGDPHLEEDARRLQADFPQRVRAVTRFDAALAHRMYAAGDLLLMPSRYEPCGLTQMIAMRYGCVPLARATGGLRDTITDDPGFDDSTGFLFQAADPRAFAGALQRALSVYPDGNLWRRIQENGMRRDFSWERSALEYARLYLNLSGRNTP